MNSGIGCCCCCFPFACFKMSKSVRVVQEFLAHVKFMLIPLFFWCLRILNISNIEDSYSKNQSDHDHDHDLAAGNRPSPLLVLVPITSVVEVELIKKRLSVIEFGTLLERLQVMEELEEKSECAICLSGLERGHQIRELSNCCHMFHRECLDEWIGKGQVTCPLCRSKLLPHHEEYGNGDPWRVERFAYLFGEDFVGESFV